jgi:phospho-N-acetylmuramoyl-pentapeptide-transferase
LGRWDIGPLYYPLAAWASLYGQFGPYHDGVDGLAASVTLASALGYAGYLCLGSESMQILSVALAGGCLGFLCWNSHPAKVFMGDTGRCFWADL